MTRDQKIEAFAMRLDGCTFEEISRKFGVSRQYIHQTVGTGNKPEKFRLAERDFIYPALIDYMVAEGFSNSKFCVFCGFPKSSAYNIGQKLKGLREFRISEIESILDATGLSFEATFQRNSEGSSNGQAT